MDFLIVGIISCIFAASVQGGVIDRIVGGKPVNISDYPYQVSLFTHGGHFCGGSIISDSWVVSAAHCVAKPKSIKIRAGSSFKDSEGEIFDVQRIIVHERYNQGSLDCDVSLLNIKGSFFSRNGPIRAIALPEPNQIYPVGTMLRVSGWGRCDGTCASGENISQLRAVDVPLLDHETCNRYYSGSITESMICAGYEEGGKDSCQGDSGGPLAVDNVLVGIVSWGFGCAEKRLPGVYASVPVLREWIKEKSGV